MQSAVEVSVTGRVQLVMFRDFTRRAARRLGLVGEVENLPDGSVRVYAEGPRETLETLIEYLNKGPLLARVERVVPLWVSPRGGFTSFSIRYT